MAALTATLAYTTCWNRGYNIWWHTILRGYILPCSETVSVSLTLVVGNIQKTSPFCHCAPQNGGYVRSGKIAQNGSPELRLLEPCIDNRYSYAMLQKNCLHKWSYSYWHYRNGRGPLLVVRNPERALAFRRALADCAGFELRRRQRVTGGRRRPLGMVNWNYLLPFSSWQWL